ncbi:G5 domain-containing protein [Protaetiibacter intestinalis]|uniref:G5 domain-containing protein n=1 Tax=Protaetiibacter intestinalis TaxID=2419774 RepID=UPI001475CDA0|nr:G5 domain-containing protein [Protaetiibacter intestinalis]
MTSMLSNDRATWPRAVAAGVALLLGCTVVGCASATPRRIAELPQTNSPSRASSPEPTRTPAVTEKVIVVTEPVAFEHTTQDDPNRDVGSSAVVQQGADGTRSITYEVTYVDGVESSRIATGDEITVAPVPEITAVGTRQPAPAPVVDTSGCDPNYSGACVPIASDVDCAGGSGNGPAYVRGPVRVIGTDIYDLDRDGDGIACD